MALFRKLDRLTRDITGKVASALTASSVTEKVDQLLAVRQESHDRMLKLERREGDIGFAGFLGFFPGMGMMIAGATPFLAAPSLAVIGLLATPLFLGGLGLAAVSLGTMLAMGQAVDRLRADRDTIEKQINREVLTLVQKAPEEANKSKRYMNALTCIYNAAAEGDKSYEKMVKRVTVKTKAPVPASAG